MNKSKRSVRIVFASLALACLGTVAQAAEPQSSVLSGQTNATSGQAPTTVAQSATAAGQPTTSSEAARPISLDVVVTDKAGNPVSGLQQENFTVLDDKQSKPMLSFRAIDDSNRPSDPLQVIFVFDEVNSLVRNTSNARQYLEKYLNQSGPQLPVPMSLVFFSDKSTEVQGTPTRNATSLVASLKAADSSLREYARGAGFYADTERIGKSLHMLEKFTAYLSKQGGRKLIIWFSPGWPLLSGPGVQLSPKDQEGIFETVVRINTHLREARVTLYSVDPFGTEDAASFRTFYYENFLKGLPYASKSENGYLGLQVLAFQSGGLVLNRNNDLGALISSAVNDSKAYYIMSFAPAAADRPNEWHAIQITVSKPGLTARTRNGYYAQRQEPAK